MKRVVVIGDTHCKPGVSNERFTWMGRYVAEAKPDNVVHIGDFGDFESVEMHSPPGSASHGNRPSFQDDMDAVADALENYHAEVGYGQIKHDVVYGNHENRIHRTEELHPNLEGVLTGQLDDIFKGSHWGTTPYRHYLMLKGVGFTHVPTTIMGKPYGGKTVERTVGIDATFPVVFGHTHRWNHIVVPKLGPNNSITVTNVGSAMQYGYVPKYCDGAMTGYTYGIADLRLKKGRVESASFVSMLDLKDRYK